MQGRDEVVLIDDNRTNILLLKELLQDDFNIQSFHCPFKAQYYITHHHPSIIISDLMMPGMNGIELLKKVKALKSDIIFIILTAHDDKGRKNKAIRNGADGFMQKPLNIREFRNTIQSIIQSVQ